MSSDSVFPSLEGFGPTKETLHLYSQGMGVVARAHAEPHPKWWHLGLNVTPQGLVTSDISLPGNGTFNLRMDLTQHMVVLTTSSGYERHFSMTEGLTSTAFGDQILAAVSELGLEGEYARNRFKSDEHREYDPALASRFFVAVSNANRIFTHHRQRLTGNVSPLNFWPHGFDLSLEWYGTRIETYEDEGEVSEYPSQLNLGYYPGDGGESSYFYSNPWPFEEDQLVNKPLPSGARWFTESWKGTILPYSELVDDPNAEERLLAYARAVYEISSPTLMA